MLWLLNSEVPKTRPSGAHRESFWGRMLLNRTKYKVLERATAKKGTSTATQITVKGISQRSRATDGWVPSSVGSVMGVWPRPVALRADDRHHREARADTAIGAATT